MAFRFSLQALLRFRQSLERQQELRLQQAQHQVALARRAIEDLDRHVAATAARCAGELSTGLSAAELQFETLCRTVLLEHRHHLEQMLSQSEEIRSSCTQALRETRRQREVVDTLRQRQLQVHRQHEKRAEQRYLDELFLLRKQSQGQG
jgi:flagellar export protein FliJ